jgi:hypothetical protein
LRDRRRYTVAAIVAVIAAGVVAAIGRVRPVIIIGAIARVDAVAVASAADAAGDQGGGGQQAQHRNAHFVSSQSVDTET